MPLMAITPDTIVRFEAHWTEQGMPDNSDMRFLFGYALGRLFGLGAPRDALLRYTEATLNILEGAEHPADS